MFCGQGELNNVLHLRVGFVIIFLALIIRNFNWSEVLTVFSTDYSNNIYICKLQ
jgi:hypothetical protein